MHLCDPIQALLTPGCDTPPRYMSPSRLETLEGLLRRVTTSTWFVQGFLWLPTENHASWETSSPRQSRMVGHPMVKSSSSLCAQRCPALDLAHRGLQDCRTKKPGHLLAPILGILDLLPS